MRKYLEYRYPGEDWQRIYAQNGGNLNYVLTQNGQCCYARYELRMRYTIRSETNTLLNSTASYDPYIKVRTYQLPAPGKIFYAGYMPNVLGQLGYYVGTEDCDGRRTYQPLIRRSLDYDRFPGPRWDATKSFFQVIEIRGGSSPNKAEWATCEGFIFKVFEDGFNPALDPALYYQGKDVWKDELFSREEPWLVLPEVRFGVDYCPVDTCAVDCGTHVCCYNSQGISVFNYLK